MPRDLILVRHGESEGNVATSRSKKGDGSLAEKIKHLHNSRYRLSSQGRAQSATAGSWLRMEFPDGFDDYYVSPYVRTRETAARLALPEAQWMQHLMLAEREWGALDLLTPEERKVRYREELERRQRDRLTWAPPGGESIIGVTQRVQRFLATLSRESAERKVIVVCHGDIMLAFRVALERLTMERFQQIDEWTNPHDHIHNCQVLHYSRMHPESGLMGVGLDWMRSVCPSDMTQSSNDWQQIIRPTFSNEELLRQIEEYPAYFAGE